MSEHLKAAARLVLNYRDGNTIMSSEFIKHAGTKLGLSLQKHHPPLTQLELTDRGDIIEQHRVPEGLLRRCTRRALTHFLPRLLPLQRRSLSHEVSAVDVRRIR